MLSGPECHDDEDDGAFTRALSRLKRRGVSVLVVGSVRPAPRRRTRRRLLGRESDCSRRRVLVSTADETSPDDESCATEIRYRTEVRNAAAASKPWADTPAPSVDETPTEVDSLTDLGIEISRAIEVADTEIDDLDPAELRVGVDSLLPLLEDHGRQRVFTFVHLTNGRALDVDGMIHYHLPVDSDAEVVSTLAPLFDVIVELRERNGGCQERWSIEEFDLSSDWIPVDRC